MFKRIYPYLLEPEKYRDYSRRCVTVPTWKAFGNQTNFASIRAFSQKAGRIVDYKEELDLYTKKFELGNVICPHFQTLFAENFKDLVNEVKKRGLYLGDFWGYVPGSAIEKYWGNFRPPNGTVEYMEEVLGDHFLGVNNGEQDGRYIGGYAPQMCPAFQNRKRQYLHFHRHFEQLCGDLKNKTSVLVSLTNGHYFLKEGNTIMVGAETGQALLNAQLYYAFLRGAGKQYGVLWYGNASVWNRKGYKNYYEGDQILKTDEGFQGYTVGPDQGTSLMLLKRLLYVHYLHNCAHAGFEMGWILGDSWEKRIDGRPIPLEKDSSTCVLTPIGEMQAAGIRFVKKYGKPGVMYAPICLMLDFYAGWRPPRHCYTRKLYQVWGNIPYSSGDHLTHGIFSLLYPGYEDSSYYPNEKGFLSSTPYGDAAEVLLTDAEESVLSFYSTVIISGEVEPSEELKVKLENFVRNGGRLVITAGNLLKFADGLAGLKATKETVSFPAGTLVLFGKEEVREDLAFQLHKTITGADQEIIVRCGKTPAVVKRKFGTGEILLCLSSFGISPYSALPGRKISIDGGTPETPLPNPFPLLAHVKHLLDALFKEERIFEVGEGLGYVTCRKGPGNYTIGIYNNGFKELPFRIKSLSGKMVSIKELPIDCSEKGKRGYWPTGFEDTDTGKNTEKTIAGGDIRIFRVTIKEKEIEEAAPLKRMNCPRDRYLSLRAIISIKEEMLNRPTFFRHFSGVKVGWDYFRDKDPVTVAAENQWLRMQKVDIIVDFSEGLNFYPDLTILDNIKWRYKDSLEKLLSVFDKMAAAGAGNAVFSLHRMPENHFTKEQTSAGFLKNVKTICKEAADRDITIHLQSHPNRWYSTTEEMLSFISEVAAPNLKFVLNLCHLLMSQSDLKSEFRKVRDICSVVLVSVPGKDSLSQTYDAHLPVTGSLFEKAIRDFLSLTNKKAIALDAEYSSGDDEFKDIRMVEVCTSSKANT